jgi:hypothetical protein
MRYYREGFRRLPAVVTILMALLGLEACSGGGRAAAPAVVGGAGRALDACERIVLKRGDLAGILNAPITQSRAVPGDVQSCAYLTEGFPAITISVRPGLGISTLDAWEHGKMPFEVSPIAGVGDGALWQAALHELIARKGDLLCNIQVRAGANDLSLAPDALSAAAGGLCNRIFAAI